MTLFSWIYMAIAWGLITAVNVFCFARSFSGRKAPLSGNKP
jgi:hypothetical protein